MTKLEKLKLLTERIDSVGIALCGLVLNASKQSRIRQMAHDYVALRELREKLMNNESEE